MALFWLGTWEVDPAVPPTGSAAEPLVSAGARTLAIEVIKEDEEFAVLFSAAEKLDDPQKLKCRIGFANGAKACNVWRDRGFPLVDATIDEEGGSLRVLSPYFADPETMQYGELLIAIGGIRFDESAGSGEKLAAPYEQFQQAPDSAWPATYIRRRDVGWEPDRSRVKKLQPYGVTLEVTRSRCPSLRPFTPGPLKLANAWSGVVALPQTPVVSKDKPVRVSRADTFGVPAFRFEDVEVLGFRIDLGNGRGLDERLAQLIEPLNFHLDRSYGRNPVADFRYRPATRTLLVELLRYGRMKLKTQESPLTVLDYQSQHELVVRLLVGRVDDDTAQAHAPAIYVPAIFVDNPWSKTLGRDVQGFAKCMADFCIEDGNDIKPLRPDGRLLAGDRKSRPLAEISGIKLVERTVAGGKSSGPTIMDLDCPPTRYRNWDAFRKVDLGLALGTFSLIGTRWRQTDFDQTEFRRSFARAAVRETLKGFHSVQVSPVGKRELDKTWITGTFTVDDDVQMASPTGGARVGFYAPDSAPSGWKAFCRLLDIPEGEHANLSFQTGSWYRLKFSMSMTVDDGLEWADARP